MSVFDKVKKCIVEQLGVDEDEVTLDPGPMVNVFDFSSVLEGSIIQGILNAEGIAQRTVYFVKLKPVEFALSDIEDVKLESFKDNLSGAMTHTPLIKMREGVLTQAVPAKEGDAAEMTQRVREFLGLKA